MADALTRLRGTTVRTNIQTGGVEETRIFGLIEEAKITRKTFDGRMLDLEITLSDWVYRSVISKNVLTLHRDYFRLRKPFERRMYELARKHCGVKEEWKIGLELLQKKCGSNSRSEERRGGQECVSTGRSRWSPYHSKNNKDSSKFYNTEIPYN